MRIAQRHKYKIDNLRGPEPGKDLSAVSPATQGRACSREGIHSGPGDIFMGFLGYGKKMTTTNHDRRISKNFGAIRQGTKAAYCTASPPDF